MSEKASEVLRAALELSKDEQLEFLELFHASLEERGVHPFDDEWSAEIERRSAKYDRGESQTYSWEEVKAEAEREARGDV